MRGTGGGDGRVEIAVTSAELAVVVLLPCQYHKIILHHATGVQMRSCSSLVYTFIFVCHAIGLGSQRKFSYLCLASICYQSFVISSCVASWLWKNGIRIDT